MCQVNEHAQNHFVQWARTWKLTALVLCEADSQTLLAWSGPLEPELCGVSTHWWYSVKAGDEWWKENLKTNI